MGEQRQELVSERLGEIDVEEVGVLDSHWLATSLVGSLSLSLLLLICSHLILQMKQDFCIQKES